jgi:hypothetical protein
VYEYFEELDEINWSARGNVLNQYLRNTSCFLYKFFRDFWRFEMDFLLFGCLETFLPFGTLTQNLRGFLSNSPLNTKQRRNIAQLAPQFTQADMYIDYITDITMI